MMKLKLYRGIAVEYHSIDETLKSVKQNGITGDEGRWSFSIPNVSEVRKQMKVLLSSRNPSVNDIFEKTPFRGICACGDDYGARYYAQKHNRSEGKDTAIIIAFTADIDRIYIDCRDFLCTAFQFWDRKTTKIIEKQKSYLRVLFGNSIEAYFDRCILTTDQSVRISMCNLAAFDEHIVLSHYKNKNLIGGRHGTRFRSAFFVQAPVMASEIDSCNIMGAEYSEKEIYVDLNRFFGDFDER